MKSWSLWVGLLLAVFALPALAAEAPKGAAPAAMAVPAPGPEVGQLSFFAGDWSCTGKAEASPFGPEHATQAKVHIRKELGGFWYIGHLEETKGPANPQPMSFAFCMGYDPGAKAWTLDGFDAWGGRSHQKAAGWQDGKLVFDGETAMGGQSTPARDTFTKKDESTLDHVGEVQADGKWVTTDHETCKRAGK